jgi:hypothetical protein
MLRTKLRSGPRPFSMLVGIGQESADYGGFLLGRRALGNRSIPLRGL